MCLLVIVWPYFEYWFGCRLFRFPDLEIVTAGVTEHVYSPKTTKSIFATSTSRGTFDLYFLYDLFTALHPSRELIVQPCGDVTIAGEGLLFRLRLGVQGL
jgi:hypothetical protein